MIGNRQARQMNQEKPKRLYRLHRITGSPVFFLAQATSIIEAKS